MQSTAMQERREQPVAFSTTTMDVPMEAFASSQRLWGSKQVEMYLLRSRVIREMVLNVHRSLVVLLKRLRYSVYVSARRHAA